MAHNKEKNVNWNKDLIYENEAAFLEAHKDHPEFTLDELKTAYKDNYAKKQPEKTK